MLLRGYGIIWADCARVDGHLEAFLPGAFKFMRSTNVRVAHARAVGSVLAWAVPVAEDDLGLRFEAALDRNSPEHRAVVRAVQDGGLTGVSPRFLRLKSFWADAVEIVTSARLLELSLVGAAAYKATGCWLAGDERQLPPALARLADAWRPIDTSVWERSSPVAASSRRLDVGRARAAKSASPSTPYAQPLTRGEDPLRRKVREYMSSYLTRAPLPGG